MKPVSNEITIRPITSADESAVVSIYKNGWLETYPNEAYGISEAAVQGAVAHFRTTTIHENKFVAEQNGEVVGVVSVKEGTPRVIQSLYVAREKQGRGIGTALLQFIFKKFGNYSYMLQVAVYNTKAIDFYKKFGFETVTNSLESVDFNTLNIPQIAMRKEKSG